MAGDKALPGAVDNQVHSFERRLADQDFVSHNECFFQRLASFQFEQNRSRDTNLPPTSIGKLCGLVAANLDPRQPD